MEYNPILEGRSEQEIKFIYKPEVIKNWETTLVIYFDNFID